MAQDPSAGLRTGPSVQDSSAQERRRGIRRTLIGVVTSDKMAKTVVVQVTRRVLDPKFRKYQTKRASYKAHSEHNDVHIGDRVIIEETRPISKDKRWRVQKLIERSRRV